MDHQPSAKLDKENEKIHIKRFIDKNFVSKQECYYLEADAVKTTMKTRQLIQPQWDSWQFHWIAKHQTLAIKGNVPTLNVKSGIMAMSKFAKMLNSPFKEKSA